MATDPEQQVDQAEREVARLQDGMREGLAALAEMPAGADRTEALDDLLSAAVELQALERDADAAQQRVERAELDRLRTQTIDRARKLAAAPVVVAVVLGVLILVTVLNPWWWLLAGALLTVGGAVMGKPIAPHRPAINDRGLVARLSVGAAVLSALAAIPWPWTTLTVVLIVMAGLAIGATGLTLGMEGTLESSKAGA